MLPFVKRLIAALALLAIVMEGYLFVARPTSFIGARQMQKYPFIASSERCLVLREELI